MRCLSREILASETVFAWLQTEHVWWQQMRPTTLSALVQNYFKLICYHMFFNKLLSVFELRTVSYSLGFFTMFFSVILWHTLLVPLPSYGEIWQQVLT